MSELKINLPYERTREKEAYDKQPEVFPGGAKKSDWLSSAELTENYISLAMQLHPDYKQGLRGQLRRVYGRIQRKLDAAIRDGKDSIEIKEDEQRFFKKLFDEEKLEVPPQISHLWVVLEDEVERATSRKVEE